MSNMGDALKTAGLISEQELARRSKAGRGQGRGRSKSRDQKDRDSSRPTAPSERTRRREAAAARLADPEAAATARSQALELLQANARPQLRHGRRRFHYADAHGRLPFLQVDEDLGQGLERGELGIARAGDKIVVVPRETALEVEGIDPVAVLFLND